jgi:hypothetical protein
MDRIFIISLGVILLAVGMLFLYFKNKIGKMEKKVDLMFQLIQEYDQQRVQSPPRAQMVGGMPQANSMTQRDNHMDLQSATSNLINVSDDDNVSDNDSEEISDSDEEDEDNEDNEDDEDDSMNHIQISSEDVVPAKSISLAGAEFSGPNGNQDDLNSEEQIDDLEDISDLDDDNNDDTNDEDIHMLESEEVLKHLANKLNNTTEPLENMEVVDEDSLKKTSVKALKQMCKEKGFTNFSALRKPKLIELLVGASS